MDQWKDLQLYNENVLYWTFNVWIPYLYKKKKATWNRNALLWFLLTQTILLLFANSSKLGLFGFSDDGDDDDDDNNDSNN